MFGISDQTLVIVATVVSGLFLFQFALLVYMAITLRIASKERSVMNKEMFGLLKKLEGLTANRRDQMLRHYDRLLDDLSTRLPPTIAAQAGEKIFETESKILARLAELEPNLRNDARSQEKINELIKSMESLEATIVTLTADTVRRVMAHNRKELFMDSYSSDANLAA